MTTTKRRQPRPTSRRARIRTMASSLARRYATVISQKPADNEDRQFWEALAVLSVIPEKGMNVTLGGAMEELWTYFKGQHGGDGRPDPQLFELYRLARDEDEASERAEG